MTIQIAVLTTISILLIFWSIRLIRISHNLKIDRNRVIEAQEQLKKEKIDTKLSIVIAKENERKMQNAMLCINSYYESLMSRFIKNRISILEINKPDFSGSAEMLYKIDDLRVRKEKGEINSIDYLREVDEIFFELEK